MNVQITHIIVHTPEQVREIVAEAIKIADDTPATIARWEVIFGKAADLLGARYTLAIQPQAAPLDLNGLRDLRVRQ